jgi:predicted amidohydrolase
MAVRALLIISVALLQGVASQQSYRAAVLEFASEVPQTSRGLIPAAAKGWKLQNLKTMESFAKEAKANGTQVMVFPEYGITGAGFISEAFTRQNIAAYLEEIPGGYLELPCGNANAQSSAPAIERASCMAKELGMTLVFDLMTKESCTPRIAGCPPDGRRQFNTAIAFSEKGLMISLYHKVHPYAGEAAWVDAGNSTYNDGVTFTTSFGVKFGMFICYDIYYSSGRDALEVVYPTEWVNGVDIDALTAQQKWSAEKKKNLLAANYGSIGARASGSGIWHAGEALVKFFNPTYSPQSKLLIADVPIMQEQIVV